MTALLVVLGAMVGAPSRHLLDLAVQRRHRAAMPWGTVTVNVLGSAVLGGLAGCGSSVSPHLTALVGTGFCGALTTFSTFSFETHRLLETGHRRTALANVLVSLAAGGAAFTAGYAVLRALCG